MPEPIRITTATVMPTDTSIVNWRRSRSTVTEVSGSASDSNGATSVDGGRSKSVSNRVVVVVVNVGRVEASNATVSRMV